MECISDDKSNDEVALEGIQCLEYFIDESGLLSR